MNLTKGIISRAEAIKLSPQYVKFVDGDYDGFNAIFDAFGKLKRNQKCLTYNRRSKQFIIGKITSLNHNDFRAIDGPVVRFGNGEYTWRIDGDGYAVAV